MQTVALGQLHHLSAGFLLLQKAHLRGLHAHDDVVQHREALHQLEMLMHHADAQRRSVIGVFNGNDLAILLDGAFLRLIQAEKHTHQRGLARAVFTQQGVNFAAP